MEDQNLPTDSKEQTAQDNLEFNSRIPLQELQQAIEALKAQMSKVIVGQDDFVELLIVSIILFLL